MYMQITPEPTELRQYEDCLATQRVRLTNEGNEYKPRGDRGAWTGVRSQPQRISKMTTAVSLQSGDGGGSAGHEGKSPQKRQATSEGPSRPKYCHELVYEVGEVAEETI